MRIQWPEEEAVGQAHGSIGEAWGGQERADDGGKRAAVLAPLEASGEEGRRAGEGRLRCGMLWGWRCPFIRAGRGAQAVVKAVG
jgi:hypothetical protein